MKIKKILPIIGLFILAIILYNLNFSKIVELFSELNPLYVFLSFFAIVPLLLLVNIEWQILLKKQHIKVSFLYSIKNFFIGYFYGFITPGAFGAYIRSLYLHDESNEPLPKCFSNIIIFNTVEFLAMLFTGAIGAIALSRQFPYLFYIILILFGIVIFLFIFFFKTNKSQALFTRLIQSQIFSAIQDKIQGNLHSFYEDIPSFKDIIIPFLLSLLGWLLKFSILYLIAGMFFITIPYIDFILIIAVVDVIVALPISIYGIGTREAALIPLFALYGVSSEQIVSFSLFWYVIIWLMPSLLGAMITLIETKKYATFTLTEETIQRFTTYMKKYPELYTSLANLIEKHLKKTKNPIILDLGCGPGILGKHIKKHQPNTTLIGLDKKQEMLQRAKKEQSYDLLSRGSVDYLPFKTDSIDLVVSRFSLPYWEQPRQSFQEIQRILKPQGILILEALNKDYPPIKLWLIKMHMSLKRAGTDVIRYHIDAYNTAKSKHDIETILKKTGFKHITFLGNQKEWKFVFIAYK